MRLVTAKYLGTVEIVGDGGNILNRARMILAGKVNDRLGAEQTVHQISNSVYQRDTLKKIAELEGINVNERDREKFSKLSFDIKLILLKLQIFSILDHEDARKVWKHIKQESSLDKIRNADNFFYHISHGPVLLLTELLEVGLFPLEEKERLASCFPRSCIVDDYEEGLNLSDTGSSSQVYLGNLQQELEKAKKNSQKKEVKRIERQIQILEENIARYL